MKTIIQLSLFALTCGLLSAQHHKECELTTAKQKAEVEDYQKIFAAAKDLIIFEGLPHPDEEEETFKEESKRKDVVKLPPLEEAFYTPAHKATNAEVLIKFLSGPGGISVNKPAKCGFHSDYCIQFKHDDTTYRAFACFGCVELFVIKENAERGSTFGFNSEALGKLLAVYDKKRPKKAKAE